MEINKRLFILTAYPKEKLGELTSLFTNKEGSIKRKLEDPPLYSGKVRYGGWSLETLNVGKIMDGQFVRVQNGERKTIDLYDDGTLIFVGLADGDFLAHASDDGLRINSIALIELVYNFVSFYKEIIEDLSSKPKNILIKFKFINMFLNKQASYLTEGPMDNSFPRNRYEASSNEFEGVFDVEIENFQKNKIGEIAYKVVEKIYIQFGATIDTGVIPYIKEENSIISIDIEQIIKK